jgi:ABC-2 type transport system ATP-binding protein
VILDEPVNGLDPEGILWIRNLLKGLAAEGRTVFVSSHLMSEMALTAEHLIVVGRGRLIADTNVDEFIARASTNVVLVRSPEVRRLRGLLLGPDVTITGESDDEIAVKGLTAEQIGRVIHENHILVTQLASQAASLEEAFMELTHDSVEYHGTAPGTARKPVESEISAVTTTTGADR